MASLLTHLLEGQNLSEFQKMAVDGDPKHLGLVGRNLTLIAINERARAEINASAVIAEAEQRAENRETEKEIKAKREQAYNEQQQADRIEAMERTGFKTLPKANRIAAMPDSDEAVDDFLSSLT